MKLKKYLGSLVRHGLTFAGGILVAKGVIDQETAGSVIDAAAGPITEVLVGVASASLGQILSFGHLAKIIPYIPKF